MLKVLAFNQNIYLIYISAFIVRDLAAVTDVETNIAQFWQ